MSNVIDIGREKVFSKEGELAERIEALCYEYSGEISLVATIGILEVVKLKIHNDVINDE